MRLIPTLPAAIPAVWPAYQSFLARACARPGCDHTDESLLACCLAGEASLIGIEIDGRPVAAGVTQVRETPRGRTCWILALGGAARGIWPAVIAEVESGAARIGCLTVEFVGRPGWRRIHPDYAAVSCEAGIHFSKRLRPA